MIFANDIETIALYPKGFFFGNEHTVLVPYNEYGKFLIRNNYEIKNDVRLRINKMYKAKKSVFRSTHLKVNNDSYVVIKRYLPKCEYQSLMRRKINELLLKYKEARDKEDESL